MRTTACLRVLLLLPWLAAAGCNRSQPTTVANVEPNGQAEQTTPHPHAARIRLNEPIPGDPKGSFEVVHLEDEVLATLAKKDKKDDDWKAIFAVYVDQGKGVNRAEQPPVAGTYGLVEGALRFEPQYSLTPGVRYKVYFDSTKLTDKAHASSLEAEFSLPKVETIGTTVLEAIYPSRAVLPENQLKFYLHFSRPMSRGQAFKHIRLIKIETKDRKRVESLVDRPFLEEELWDPMGKRFTLLLDPGRIKRGLKPREELGPALLEGGEYALAIASEWPDAEGKPLQESLRKGFKVIAPDEVIPDPQKWEIIGPPAATVEPIIIKFPEPMDHALLQRCIWVLDPKGHKRHGTVTVKFQELQFEYAPEDPWEVGKYTLVVDTDLEDLAANNLRGPFEVDVLKKIDQKVETQTIQIPFEVPIPGKEAPIKVPPVRAKPNTPK